MAVEKTAFQRFNAGWQSQRQWSSQRSTWDHDDEGLIFLFPETLKGITFALDSFRLSNAVLFLNTARSGESTNGNL